MDYREFWRYQTTSRRNGEGDDNYFFDRAREFAALMLPQERNLPAVDIGCGAGEILEHLVNFCNVVEAFDYSPSLVEQAKRRLQGKSVRIYLADAVEKCKRLPIPIWITAGAINQYVHPVEISNIVSNFAQQHKAQAFFLFDTIDPARYRLWQSRLISRKAEFFEPTWRRLIFFFGKLLWESVRMRRLWFRLEGAMGYAYRPYFWHVLGGKLNLSVEIVNSWYLEYRYHVILRKS